MSKSSDEKHNSSKPKKNVKDAKPFTIRFLEYLREQFEKQNGNTMNLAIKCSDGDVLCFDGILFTASEGIKDKLEFVEEIDGPENSSQMSIKVEFPSAIVKDLLSYYYSPKEQDNYFDFNGHFRKYIEDGQAIIYLEAMLYFGFNDILKMLYLGFNDIPLTINAIINYSAFVEKISKTGFHERTNLTFGRDMRIYQFIRDNLGDPRIGDLFRQPFFFSNFPGTLHLLDTLLKSGLKLEEVANNKTFQMRKFAIAECLCLDYIPQLSMVTDNSGRKIFPRINELREAIDETYNYFINIKSNETEEKNNDLSILRKDAKESTFTRKDGKPFVFIKSLYIGMHGQDLPINIIKPIARFCINSFDGSPDIVYQIKDTHRIGYPCDVHELIITKNIKLMSDGRLGIENFNLSNSVSRYSFDDLFESIEEIYQENHPKKTHKDLEEYHHLQDLHNDMQIGRSDQITLDETIEVFGYEVNLESLKSGYYLIR